MMPLTFYLWLHLLGIIGWVSSASLYLYSESAPKATKVLYGIFSLAVLTGGFGMIARLGVSMHQPWIAIKLLVWMVLAAIVPMVAKRAPEKKSKLFWLTIIGVCIAATVGVYHN